VSGDDDDEALTWAGGRDPSHYETPEPKVPKPGKPPRGTTDRISTSVADTHTGTDTDDEDEDALPPAMSAVVLVCLGVLGGIYLLYTIGWFASWQRLVYVGTDPLELAAFHIQQVLAILAPPSWFVATIFFSRDRKSAVRLLWLVIGALLLVPWSFTFGQ
jgi:hypothetical protein